MDYAKKGLGFAKRLNQPARLGDAYHRMAKAKEAVGETAKALRYSETAYAFYDQLNDEMGCAMTLYHQATLYEDKDDHENAIRCLERVVTIDEKYGLPKLAENKSRLDKLRAKRKRP
jgi:tetratricopeptide (TPR) repeat protein